MFDDEGLTPLHNAVLEENFPFVTLLLKHQANPNMHAKYGYTPLHLSVIQQQIDIAKLLITNGADINSIDEDGATPLQIAKQYGYHTFNEILVTDS